MILAFVLGFLCDPLCTSVVKAFANLNLSKCFRTVRQRRVYLGKYLLIGEVLQ